MFLQMTCDYCSNSFERKAAEVKRQMKKGRKYFFCSLSCAAKSVNEKREDLRHLVKKICPECKKEFETLTGCKSSIFCSKSCASKGSMNEFRREAQRLGGISKKDNLITVVETLKIRESWKYSKIKEYLDSIKEVYEFEYSIDGYVFDLILKSRKMLIEFDGIYHSGLDQKKVDTIKNSLALSRGYKIERIKVTNNSIIDPTVLHNFIA